MLDDPNTAREIEEHFSADWNHQPTLSHSSELIWSPDDSRKKINALISQAKQSISVYTQQLGDYKIIGALAKAARKGVRVNVLTSRKLNDKQTAYLQKAGVNIRYSQALYIHAKAFIIDQQEAMIGSTNLTRASLDDNRELSVITEDKSVIQQLDDTFAKDWEASNEDKKATNWLPNKRTIMRTMRALERYM